MNWLLLRNLQMFKDLCGVDAMSNVIVVTTMWGKIREGGVAREEQLKKECRGGILENGRQCHTHWQRFKDSHESAWDIIGSFNWDEEQHVLLSQEAVTQNARQRLQLNKTQFGKDLDQKLKKLIKDRDLDQKLKRLIIDQNEACRRLEEQAETRPKWRRSGGFSDQFFL